MGKAKKRVFSIVKAVKENARDRVGPVPPERVIPDPKQKAAAKPKHKKSLADLLDAGEENLRDPLQTLSGLSVARIDDQHVLV